MVLEKKGRERERRKNSDVREKPGFIASCIYPDQGLNPKPRYVPWPGIKPATFWCTGEHYKQLSLRGDVREVFKALLHTYSHFSLDAGCAFSGEVQLV